MTRNRLNNIVGILLGTFCLNTAFSADPIPLRHTPFSQVQRLFHSGGALLAQARGTTSGDLRLLSSSTDNNAIIHSRMQQYYKGYLVFGGYAVLHSHQPSQQLFAPQARSLNNVAMDGVLYQGLVSDLGLPAANFEERGQEALMNFKSQFSGKALSDEKVLPMVYVDHEHKAHWAYKVSVVVSSAVEIPERPTAILDAETYQPFVKWNDIKQIRTPVMGRGYGGNEHAGLYQYGGDFPLLAIVRNNATQVCYMENKSVRVVNMKHQYEDLKNRAMNFMCDASRMQADGSYLTGSRGNGYDRINGAYSPANDALYSGVVINEMYKKWYGVNALEKNGKPKQLLMRVHFGIRFENAFWDGEQMTFGDGGMRLYPLVSLGVGAHEISHGFTEQHSDLAYFGQSGGLNESFSDMAAQAAEYYSTGKNTWMIGGEITKPQSGKEAFRYMDVPSKDGFSIDSAEYYNDDMDVHYSSGVFNRMFYLLSTTPDWDVKKAFGVMLTANRNYWTPTATFDEAACGVLDAAKSLNYSLSDVKTALDGVGVHYFDCNNESRDVTA